MEQSIAVTSVTAVALPASALAEPNPDAEVWALWLEWKASLERARDAFEVCRRALAAAEPEYKPEPFVPVAVHAEYAGPGKQMYKLHERKFGAVRDVKTRQWRAEDHRFVDVQASSRSEADQICRDRKKYVMAEYDAKRDAAHKRHGVDEAEAAEERAWDAVFNVEHAIAEARAETMLGVAIKLRLWKRLAIEQNGIEDDGMTLDLFVGESAFQDAERLTGNVFEDDVIFW